MKRRCIQINRHIHFSFCPFLVTLTLLLNFSVAEAAKMYWTDARGIHRAGLDGKNMETLIPVMVLSPGYIAIDTVGEKIYWTDPDTRKIQRANLNGTDVEDIITQGLMYPIPMGGSQWGKCRRSDHHGIDRSGRPHRGWDWKKAILDGQWRNPTRKSQWNQHRKPLHHRIDLSGRHGCRCSQ